MNTEQAPTQLPLPTFKTLPGGPGEHRQHIVSDRRHGRGAAAPETSPSSAAEASSGPEAASPLPGGASALPGQPTPQLFLTITVDGVTGKQRISGNAPTAFSALAMLHDAQGQVIAQMLEAMNRG